MRISQESSLNLSFSSSNFTLRGNSSHNCRCGHCKKLAPIYDEVATELKDQGSPVRLAKIDCDEYGSVKSTYGIQGFPTLKFYIKGEKQDYSGQRTK
jgi:thiol-disulfide isomerase/thioredoxin